MKERLLKTFWRYIGKSVLNNFGDKVSTTRIQSYFILGSILTATAVFLGIDVVNAIILWVKNKGSYTVPYEHIVLFGMVLGHHLALLGINKNSETKTTASYYKEKTQELVNSKESNNKEVPGQETSENEENQDLPK